MASTELTGGSMKISKTLTVVAAAVLLISACGGDSSATDDTTSTSPDAQTETTFAETTTSEAPAETPADDTEPEEPAGSTGCTLDDFRDGDSVRPASCGGNATVVLGGETIEFDSFACFTGEDAVEATNSDRTTFSSIGVTSNGGSLAAIVFSVTSGIAIYDIAYVPDVDADVVWHGQANSGPAEVDGDHVTFQGDFEEVSGGDTPTGASESGSIDATCAP